MSMQVISWEDYIGTGDQGSGIRDFCSNNSNTSEVYLDSSNSTPLSLVPDPRSPSLAVTVGVFDGVHIGHQALIQRICVPDSSLLSSPRSPIPDPRSPLSVVVTFRQNPLKVLHPDSYTGDICTLEEKLHMFEDLGVQLTVLIDFSRNFSKISGREFINLLLGSRPVKLIAIGRDFRCGHHLDIGAGEIQKLARERGIEAWVAEPVMDSGQPVSSSRIRQALAAGQTAEAERLLGRNNNVPNRR